MTMRINNKTCALLLFMALRATQAYRLAIVPKNTAPVGFFERVEQGCQDTAANMAPERNISCFYTGTYDANVTGSLEIINRLIDDPTIDAISISVLDTAAYVPVIDRGVQAGKPILTFDSDAPESKRLAYVGTDNVAMGRELAKLLKQIAPTGGTYGIVSGLGLNLQQRVAGVREVLADSAWVEVEQSPKNGHEDAQKSLDAMWEIVQENPDVGAIVSVVGLPMHVPTETWKHFVDSNRNVLTVISDALPSQVDLMQTSYVDALVGQLSYNMGVLSTKTLVDVLDKVAAGIPLEEQTVGGSAQTIYGTHQLEVLRIPLELPPLNFDQNHLGTGITSFGFVLCGVVSVAAVGFMAWTWTHRQHKVVVASQPVFLVMIGGGCLLMGLAIIPLSIDDSVSQRAADLSCMAVPWLTTVGFTGVFSALFSKTWRLNKIFLSPNPLRRIKVTEKDVMLPFIVLMSVNIITLLCWTLLAPLRFVRTLEQGTDPWNRPIGSYGHCKSTSGAAGDSLPYLLVIAAVNLTALLVANFQAYRARNTQTEFNESSYIAAANASFLQAIVVCIPIIFLTRENPEAYYLVVSIVIFIISGAILVFIFVPKIAAVRESKKNRGIKRQSSIRISGLGDSLAASATAAAGTYYRRSSSVSSSDPISALLLDFQRLSWEDKTTAMQKLSAAYSGLTATPEPATKAAADLVVKKDMDPIPEIDSMVEEESGHLSTVGSGGQGRERSESSTCRDETSESVEPEDQMQL